MALDFEASGDEASALLRAHELGCLPEAAVALVALTDHRLVGANAEGGLMHTEHTWPSAWRVHAARSHRALAVGCDDDIDLLLRIFSEWQTAPDPDGWCAMWWINPTTMRQIETEVANVFTNLATAGPIGMRHPVDPGRAPLVREAIAAAFPTSEYVQTAPGEYRSTASEGTGPVHRLSPSVITDPGTRFIALARDAEQQIIEHIVAVPAPGSAPRPSDPLAVVRTQWPVGSIVEIETLGSVAGGRIVLDVLTVNRGFPYPDGIAPSPIVGQDGLPELVAVAAHDANPIDGSSRSRVRVTGYDVLDESSAVLIVDPLQTGAPIDPAEHPDLGTWDDVEVAVHGMTADHYGPLLELGRTDGLGGFVIPPAAGLAADDIEFGSRLVEGSVLTARVIPEPPVGDHVTVSLLPTVLRHLENAPGVEDDRPVAGRIVAREGGVLTVELAHRDDRRGISHRFNLGVDRVNGNVQPLPGTEVSVVLQADRTAQRRRIAANRGLVDFASRNSDTFEITDGWLQLTPSPPHIPAVLALLSYSGSPEWEREVVWMYEDNLHLEAVLVGEPTDHAIVEAAASSPGFLLPAPSRTVEAAAAQPDTDADTEQNSIATPPATLVARLPEGGPERVRGRNGEALEELRRGPGVVSVELEGDHVTIVAETGRAVRSVISEIQRLILPAKGKLIVPPGQGKRLIGIDGTTLRALEAKTGAKAAPPKDGELWTVEGPSSQAVKAFIRLAAEQVPGVAGRVIGIEDIEVLEDRTMPGQGSRPPGSAHSEAAPPIGSADSEPVVAGDDGETAASPDGDVEAAPRKRPLTVKEMQAAVVRAEKRRRSETTTSERKPRWRKGRKSRKNAAAAPVDEAPPEREPRQAKAIKPKAAIGTVSRAASLLVKTVVLLVIAAAVAVTLLYVVPRFAGDNTIDAAQADTIGATIAAAPVVPFATLEDGSAATAESCWLSVLATWATADQANAGVNELGQIGLAAVALPSAQVPGWAPGSFTTVVASETASQAADVIARAASSDFRGVLVESTPADCSGVTIVPAASSVGFVDVPVTHVSHAAILWMANTGLASACNAPIGDEFCPTDTVTTAELEAVLEQALITPPDKLDASDVAATWGDLTGALGLSDIGDPSAELTRSGLALALYEAHEVATG